MEKSIKRGDRCFSLEKIKKEFEKFQKTYELPEFSKLNELFDIENVDTETEFLLRRIRREISERISAYSRFIEIILNPSNAPIFFFKLLKKLDSKDKEILGEVYRTLGNLELETIVLDLEYSEKKEAEFIKKMYEVFNKEIRLEFIKIIEKLSINNDKSREYNGSYFG